MGLNDDKTILGGSGEDDGGSGSLAAGTQLGDYRIVQLLGKGAMGEVYEAEQVHLRQRYAVKVLPAELSQDPRFRERFRTEAQTLASLRHPNVVSIHNAGEAEGRFFLVMERLAPFEDERSLGAGVERVDAIRSVLEQVLSGLVYAHGKGVVHRDLKPANLLQGEDGAVKIGDFGVAEVVGEDFVQSVVKETIARTQTGAASTLVDRGSGSGSGYAGTLQYMAPEVLEGARATEQSDLYAVGVMAYEWLTGRKPVGRYKDASKLVEGLDPSWDEWLNGILEPDPDERTESAEAALDGLRELSKPVAAPDATASKPKEAVRPERKSAMTRWAMVLPLLVILLSAGAAMGYYYGIHLPAERERERIAEEQRIADEERRAEEARLAYDALREQIDAVAEETPITKMGDLEREVEGYLTEAEDPYRGQIRERWLEKRSAVEHYWETARGGLTLDTEPSGAEVRIGELPVEHSPVRLSDLRLGEYPIEIVHPGYESWSGVVEVENERHTDMGTIALERSTGSVRIEVQPEGARWELLKEDGEIEPVAGEGAGVLDGLPTGQYTLSSVAEGYRDWELRLVVARNEEQPVSVALEFQRGSLEMTLANERILEPERIRILLDGEEARLLRTDTEAVGRVYRVDEVIAGDRGLEIRHPRYEPLTFNPTIRDRRITELEAVLEPLPARVALEVQGPGRGEWTLKAGGETVSADNDGRFQLPAEEKLDLRVSAREWQPWEEQMILEAAGERVLQVALEEYEGPLDGEDYSLNLGSNLALELVWIPSGEFVMGSPSNEQGRRNDEGPQTHVRLTSGFWLGKTPVTVGEFRAFADESGYRTEAEQDPEKGVNIFETSRWRGGSWEEGPNRNWRNTAADNERNPVVGVSWNDAMAFCEWLTEREREAGRLPEGFIYTLPSEAQWEYAARAGTTTPWSFGDDPAQLGNYAWYQGNSRDRVHPVGTKRANPWGLHDVHGNVWEWTRSWFGAYPGDSVTDYEGPSSGSQRVDRGGAWPTDSRGLRVSYRDRSTPGNRFSLVGFRLAIAPSPQ